tara:strand:+ start:3070 stop:3417 length:348 start_codon:yes stop_codon:yes gene_type:complete
MITDNARTLITTYLETILDTATIGFGGNNSSSAQTTLDVPSTLAASAVVLETSLSDLNVIEAKVSIAGSHLTGKVTREMGLFKSSGELLSRINFEGVGPFASDETLEIFLIIEVE